MRRKVRSSAQIMMAMLGIVTLTSGCQANPSNSTPQAPAHIPPKTLTAFTQLTGYVYIDKQWQVLSAAASHTVPSAPFTNVHYSKSGILTAQTIGGNSNAFIGNEVELWMYDKAWKQMTIRGDKTIAQYVWSPKSTLYAAPDDGETAGIWMKTPAESGRWRQVPGSAQFGFINSMQFSPTGILTITYQSSDGSASLAQYENGSWTSPSNSHEPFAADAIQVKWSPSGVLTVGTNHHGIWMDENGVWKRPGGVKCPIEDVSQVKWSPQGQMFIAGSTRKSTGLWTFSSGHWHAIGGATSNVGHHAIRQFGWSPTGVLTISDGTTGQLDQFTSGKWKMIRKPPRSRSGAVPTFGWSPDGQLTCDGGSDGSMWTYYNGKWTEIGGSSSPLHSQQVVHFTWS